KSRLSLHVASNVLDQFTNGVWLVELAPLSDPSLVPQAVASALGVSAESGRPLLSTLRDHLRARHAVLILDNCEHLVAACAELAGDLLQSCASVKVLATSREA